MTNPEGAGRLVAEPLVVVEHEEDEVAEAEELPPVVAILARPLVVQVGEEGRAVDDRHERVEPDARGVSARRARSTAQCM